MKTKERSSAADIVATIDARGLRCPMPVVKMEAALRQIAPGDAIKILADDPIAAVDIPHFCRQGGHRAERLLPEETGGAGDAQKTGGRPFCVFRVTRGGKPTS